MVGQALLFMVLFHFTNTQLLFQIFVLAPAYRHPRVGFSSLLLFAPDLLLCSFNNFLILALDFFVVSIFKVFLFAPEVLFLLFCTALLFHYFRSVNSSQVFTFVVLEMAQIFSLQKIFAYSFLLLCAFNRCLIFLLMLFNNLFLYYYISSELFSQNCL